MPRIINIKGDIISNDSKWFYDWFGCDSACPNDITSVLSEVDGKEDIVIHMNSGGGSVIAADEIYTAIAMYAQAGNNIEIYVLGLAGSAASEIMTACTSKISPVASVMIHNCSSYASGDYRDMNAASNMLQTVNQSIRNAYKAKTGLSDEKLIELMDAETWMTADEAVELGFCDEVLNLSKEEEQKDVMVLNTLPRGFYNSMNEVSASIIEKFKNIVTVSNALQNNTKPTDLIGKNQEEQQAFINKTKNNVGGTAMTLKELLEQNPEVQDEINQLQITARNEGVEQERTRIQSIDNIGAAVKKETLEAAKYTEPITAAELALQVLENSAKAGESYLKNAIKDSKDSGSENIGTDPSDSTDEDEEEALINMMASIANQGRKEPK